MRLATALPLLLCSNSSATSHFPEGVVGQPQEQERRCIRWQISSSDCLSDVCRWGPWLRLIVAVVVLLAFAPCTVRIVLRLQRWHSSYAQDEDSDWEEPGWIHVHTEVFRPPSSIRVLAAFVAYGWHTFAVVASVIGLGLMGQLSCDSVLHTWRFVATLMSAWAGYVASRFSRPKALDSNAHSMVLCLTCALCVPCSIVTVLIGDGLELEVVGVIMYLFASAALSVLGFTAGIHNPMALRVFKTNVIPRMIPPLGIWGQPLVACGISGLVLCLLCLEPLFVILSLWREPACVCFSMASIAMTLTLLTALCVEVAIVSTFQQLMHEDYRWWWRAFQTSAWLGLYLFLLACVFCPTGRHYALGSLVHYLACMLAISVATAVTTGAIGMTASFCLVRSMYGRIVID